MSTVKISALPSATVVAGTSPVPLVYSGVTYGANLTTIGAFVTTNAVTVSATGNITGGNVSGTNLAGALTTAAQGNITAVGTLSSLSVSGNITSSVGNLSMGNVLTGGLISATGNITGGNLALGSPLVAANGGTGISTYTVGDIIYASTTTAFTKLAASTSGYLLQTNGAGTAPTWAAPPVAAGVPSGSVIPFAGSSAPTGYLLCFGQAVSRTTYSDLFAVTSTTYGIGDGTTTFNLPDLRGRLAAGVDNMGGTAANRITSGGSGITGTTLGAAGGAETVALSTAQLASHTHTIGGNDSTAGSPLRPSFVGGSLSDSLATSSAGSGTAHNNTQPTMMLNYIIKT